MFHWDQQNNDFKGHKWFFCENANDSKIEWICLYYPSIIFAHELSYHQINVNIVSRVANAGKEAYLGGKKSVRNMDFE